MLRALLAPRTRYRPSTGQTGSAVLWKGMRPGCRAAQTPRPFVSVMPPLNSFGWTSTGTSAWRLRMRLRPLTTSEGHRPRSRESLWITYVHIWQLPDEGIWVGARRQTALCLEQGDGLGRGSIGQSYCIDSRGVYDLTSVDT